MSTNEPPTKEQISELLGIAETLLEGLKHQQEALRCQQEIIKILNSKVEDLENRIDLVEKLL